MPLTAFLTTYDLRILPTSVDDDALLDRGRVGAIDMHFTGTASEAFAGIADCLLLCIGRCKRWSDAVSLERNPRAFEFLTWPDFRQRDEKMVSCSLFRLAGPKNNVIKSLTPVADFQ